MEIPARISVALLLSLTPVRKTPLPRAWSPPPSAPARALRWSSPPTTCRRLRRAASGSSVGLSLKSAPLPVGHQVAGIAPLGKYTNAVRNGAPVAVVASPFAASAASTRFGTSDASEGSAMHAPRPRKKCRRSIALKCCSAAETAGAVSFFMVQGDKSVRRAAAAGAAGVTCVSEVAALGGRRRC